jgi:hypothetical protein
MNAVEASAGVRASDVVPACAPLNRVAWIRRRIGLTQEVVCDKKNYIFFTLHFLVIF